MKNLLFSRFKDQTEAVLSPIANRNLSEIGFFRIRKAELAGIPVHIARTGYTGEGMNGFEIFTRTEDATAIWNALIASSDVSPAGLGARDTLRIEASLPLYGQELDEATTPLEAGLDIFVSQKSGFAGADALEKQRADGLTKTLVMIEMIDRGIPDTVTKSWMVREMLLAKLPVANRALSKKKYRNGLCSTQPFRNRNRTRHCNPNRALKARIVPRPFFKR